MMRGGSQSNSFLRSFDISKHFDSNFEFVGFELADVNKLVEKVFNETPKFWLCLFS
jgi:hypothetical protein